MSTVLRQAEKAAASNIPVLIEGESGVGKEMIARAIHGSGERKSRPFVAVNCGAIPDNLVESILFGHETGAFTGASERHVGKFAEADGGTLFLDEVGELPLTAQVKLLRALQEGEIEPVGARKSVQVDVRVISATNRNLIADVKSGRFREDLFYRLHVFPISVPPLRDAARGHPGPGPPFPGPLLRGGRQDREGGIGRGDRRCSRACRWPGNVRQLENAVFRAVVLAENDEIGLQEFPQLAARPCLRGHALDWSPIKASGADPTTSRDRLRSTSRRRRNRLRPGPAGAARTMLRRSARFEELEGRDHPLCHRPLPRADVGGRPQAADRPFDPVPEAGSAQLTATDRPEYGRPRGG